MIDPRDVLTALRALRDFDQARLELRNLPAVPARELAIIKAERQKAFDAATARATEAERTLRLMRGDELVRVFVQLNARGLLAGMFPANYK